MHLTPDQIKEQSQTNYAILSMFANENIDALKQIQRITNSVKGTTEPFIGPNKGQLSPQSVTEFYAPVARVILDFADGQLLGQMKILTEDGYRLQIMIANNVFDYTQVDLNNQPSFHLRTLTDIDQHQLNIRGDQGDNVEEVTEKVLNN